MNRSLSLLLTCLTIFALANLVAPQAAEAVWSTDPTVNLPVCTAANDQLVNQHWSVHRPTTVSDGSGGSFVTWLDSRSGNWDIYVQHVDASGTPQWTPDGVPVCTAAGTQEHPHLTPDGTGGIIVTWRDYRGPGTLYAQLVDASGTPQWTADGVLLSTFTNDKYYPNAVSDGAGGAIITWMSSPCAPCQSDVYAQRIDASGTVLWGPSGVGIAVTLNVEGYSKLVSDGVGGAIITWWDDRNGQYDVFAQRVGAGGGLLWAPAGVPLCTDPGQQRYTTITTDGAGGAVVIWWDERNWPVDVYAQRVDASGTPLWTPDGVALCTAAGHQEAYQLIPDGSGGALVAWTDRRSGTRKVYAHRIDGAGVPLWTPDGVALCTGSGSQWYPTLAPDGAGGAVVSWYDDRSGPNDIYAQRVDASGSLLWAAAGVALSTATGTQEMPQIASDGNGGAIVVWQDRRAGNSDVYAQQVSADGLLGVLPPPIALGMDDANLQSDCLSSTENEFTVCVTVTDITPDPTDVQAMKLDFSFDDAELDLLSIDIPGGSIWGAGSDYAAFTSTGAGTGELNISSLLFGGISVSTGGTVCCLTFERKTGAVGVLDYAVSAADIRDPLNVVIPADLTDAGGSVTRILGDFTTTLAGGATDCGLPGFGPPDGGVDVFDLAVFSNHFGAVDPAAEYCCIVDVGPTTTNYISGEPLIDGSIDFEDLIIFSISFGFSTSGGYTAPAPGIVSDEPSRVRLLPVSGGSSYVVELELSPAAGVQALHAVLDYDPTVLRFVDAEAMGKGSFLGVIPGRGVNLNLAALGVENAWNQNTSLARVTFDRVGEGSAELSFAALDLRSSFNQRLAAQGEGLTLGGPVASSPATLTFLAPASPNPFTTATTIGFSMVSRSEYSLTIHDVAGRLVRRFTGSAGPGKSQIVWDGRDDSGNGMGSGLYFYRLKAGTFTATKTVVLAN